MRTFFAEALPEIGETLTLDKNETRHALQTLRMQVGDDMCLLDGLGNSARAELVEIKGRNSAVCKVLSIETLERPSPGITLFVAPPSNATLAFVLKQCVELGVEKVYLMSCRYSVSKPKAGKDYRAELVAAAKQCGNPFLPKVVTGISFKEALALAPEVNFYGAVPQDDSPRVESGAKFDHAGIWIGPEGGFSEQEVQNLQNKATCPLAVGPYILRVETAVGALLSVFNDRFRRRI